MAEEKAAAEPKKAEAKPKKGAKRSSAVKRSIQNEQRRLRNRSFRSSVLTAVRDLEATLSQKKSEAVSEKLNRIYSLMDKGVKKGVYKRQKAARTKSRLAARAARPA